MLVPTQAARWAFNKLPIGHAQWLLEPTHYSFFTLGL